MTCLQREVWRPCWMSSIRQWDYTTSKPSTSMTLKVHNRRHFLHSLRIWIDIDDDASTCDKKTNPALYMSKNSKVNTPRPGCVCLCDWQVNWAATSTAMRTSGRVRSEYRLSETLSMSPDWTTSLSSWRHLDGEMTGGWGVGQGVSSLLDSLVVTGWPSCQKSGL